MKRYTPTLYFRMPRVASHSIMRLVSHRCAILPHALSPEHVRHVLKVNAGLFRWTFVRNPFTRFVSAYRWAQREYESEEYPLDPYITNAVRGVPIGDVAANLPALCALGPAIHFHPQTSFIFDEDKLLVEWVGRFERLADDFGRIAARLFIDRKLESGPNLKAPGGPVVDDGLDDETRALVADFYADDFERLGYRVPELQREIDA